MKKAISAIFSKKNSENNFIFDFTFLMHILHNSLVLVYIKKGQEKSRKCSRKPEEIVILGSAKVNTGKQAARTCIVIYQFIYVRCTTQRKGYIFES